MAVPPRWPDDAVFDGSHPNAAGCAMLAQAVHKALPAQNKP